MIQNIFNSILRLKSNLTKDLFLYICFKYRVIVLKKTCKARVKLFTSDVPNVLLMSENNRVLLSIRFSACEVRTCNLLGRVVFVSSEQ